MDNLHAISDALAVLDEAVERLEELGIKAKVTIKTKGLNFLVDTAIKEITDAEAGVWPAQRRARAPMPLPAVFDDSRLRKVKAVQDFLRSNGVTSGEWFETHSGIPDSAVNWAYIAISTKEENRDKMNRVLKEATRGDRFGNIHSDKTSADREW